MRAALWLLILAGIAAAVALFAGNNQGSVTLFWPPYRIDLSLNLVLLLLVGAFLIVHTARGALNALLDLPRQALRWRTQQKERAMHASLLDALSHLLAGRYIRARKSAEAVLVQETSLTSSGQKPGNAGQLRAIAHLLAAESAQALQDRAAREDHLQRALEQASARDAQETRDGAVLRAARWALEDRDPESAMKLLQGLPQGAGRRTVALRTRLRASRQAGAHLEALETARLLAKHHAFSEVAARSIVRGLAIDLLNGAYDVAQLQRAWGLLDPAERLLPDVAIHAAHRLATLRGDTRLAREWLLPVWEQQAGLGDALRVKLVRHAGRGLARAHRGGAEGEPARRHAAVPGRHGLHGAPAVGQGAAAPDPGRARPAGPGTAPQCLAGAGGTRRAARGCAGGGAGLEARGGGIATAVSAELVVPAQAGTQDIQEAAQCAASALGALDPACAGMTEAKKKAPEGAFFHG
jgi:HemY protein